MLMLMMSIETIKAFQVKYLTGNDNCKDPLSFFVRPTTAVQCKDDGSWMHRVNEEVNSTVHNIWSYIIRITNVSTMITCNVRHTEHQ